ncbi:MAG: hypothetical protein AAF557_20510 [Pseudomonadota bacterium]
MKAGFKPKQFTKKEWQDNRSRAASGSGVGKALDQWNKVCKPKLSLMTLKELNEAAKAAKGLDDALGVAEKKCDRKKQKDTISGIGEYRKVVNSYKAALLKAIHAHGQRESFVADLKFDKVEKDAALMKLYGKYWKDHMRSEAHYFTYLLCKKKKYAEAVKKYGDGGQKEGDYNIRPSHNKILWNTFVDHVYEEKKRIDRAIQVLETTMAGQMTTHMAGFKKWPLLAKYAESQFKIADAA